MSANQLKLGAVLNYFLIFLNLLVGLIYTPFMLRMMGQREYGLYALVASVISYLTVLDLGMGNAIIRYTAKYRAEGKFREQYEMFGMFLILYVVVSLVTLVLGLALFFNVDRLFSDTMTDTELGNARVMMFIMVFNLVITFPLSIFGSIITAYEKFVFQKIVNIIRTILNTVIMIVLLSLGYKAVAMVVLMTVFNIVTLTINYIYCKKKLLVEIHFGHYNWGFLKEVALYSFWILLSVVIDRVYWSSGQFVLGSVSGTIAVSVFAVAIQLESMYMMFSTAIVSLFLPKITGMVTKGADSKEISDLFIKTGRLQSIIMSLVLWGFIVFGEQFICLWVGKTYIKAYIMAVSLFVALYIPVVQNLAVTILQARNQMMFRSILYIIIAICTLFAEYLLGKAFGGIGCAIAISCALFLGQGIIMNIYYMNKQSLDIPSFWLQILKLNIFPIIISILFFYISREVFIINSWTKLGMGIIVYLIIYIPICFCLSMNQYEKNLFLKPIANRFGK